MTSGGIGAGREPMGWIPLAGPQQVRDGAVGTALDDVADAIAAVQETTALAVDHAQGRLAGDDPGEPRGIRSGVLGGDGWRVGHAPMVAEGPAMGRAGWPGSVTPGRGR